MDVEIGDEAHGGSPVLGFDHGDAEDTEKGKRLEAFCVFCGFYVVLDRVSCLGSSAPPVLFLICKTSPRSSAIRHCDDGIQLLFNLRIHSVFRYKARQLVEVFLRHHVW